MKAERTYTGSGLMRAVILTLFVSFSSCDDFVNVDLPSSRITQEGAFNSDQTATAAALGMYTTMGQFNSFAASGGLNSVTTLAAFSADEFTSFFSSNSQFVQNNLEASNPAVLSLWTTAYKLIYTANTVIEGVSQSGKLTTLTRQQLEGEARFVRAFTYFYLVNLFGKAPLVLTTDYRVNATIKRAEIDLVYAQILTDLLASKELLSVNYVNGSNAPTQERFRPNRFAALTLLARVYLYLKDWENAELYASAVINETATYELSHSLDDVFLAGSKEAIWQVSQPSDATNSVEGVYFIPTSGSVNQIISENLLNSFEEGDNRRTKWIGFYQGASTSFFYPFKYKVRNNTIKSEHSIVLRLTELYLIRAEARAQQERLNGSESAASDLNIVRERAGLPELSFGTKEGALSAVLRERRVELFSEWGHRWFDLRRSGVANEVLGDHKPNWNEQDLLYPIPEKELMTNPSLAPQNPGY